MSINLGYVPTIVVSSPEAAELFLKVHDVVFAGRPKLQISDYMTFGAKGLAFTQYGSYWRTVRKWCTLHLLSASKVESFAPVRKAEMVSLVESARTMAAKGETLNLSQQVGKVVEVIMCRVIFGRCLDDEIEFMPLIEEAMYLAGVFNLSDYVPFLAPLDLQGIKRRFKRLSNGLHAFFDKLIDEHERGSTNIEEQKSYTDFFHIMVSLLNTPMNPADEEKPYIIGRENIKAIIVDMVAASFETTSTSIEWTLSELLKHPRVMAGLQQQLETVVGRNRMVEESDLPKLTYLDMVIKESFRGCPGMQLGLTTMRLIIAQLVHCFDWELPDELDMTETFGLTVPRANHLFAKPTYRLVG
ncbi:TRANSPARENT TESTA 7, CYTOCHROME P450 75B1 [Hibiscus trionum]|uniref:TRANSPARENT TESTA 7, CYTOCHROME P450 75B1 n=1 Tax=Hibiscus trionum TaxID=183268 RepID=A0A9W7J273_HIBTR|nr:TRANSPARENT TESTA 7, CYTOCHROME P450 75B1 [Hibiscus trionum]